MWSQRCREVKWSLCTKMKTRLDLSWIALWVRFLSWNNNKTCFLLCMHLKCLYLVFLNKIPASLKKESDFNSDYVLLFGYDQIPDQDWKTVLFLPILVTWLLVLKLKRVDLSVEIILNFQVGSLVNDHCSLPWISR